MLHRVYADHAASTPVEPTVIQAVQDATHFFGNPSSVHNFGREARAKLDESRRVVADFLACKSEEIIFTSSGTESNNIAIIGTAKANRAKGNHIITSAIEHPSVVNACRALEKEGFIVTYLPVKSDGLIDSAALEAAITDKTILVTFHLANSEIGVIQNITELAATAKRNSNNIAFHVDACQAAAFIELDVKRLGVDLLTFNGTKIYGPRGTGVLFVKEKHQIFPIVYGGGQEQSLRSGTENVSAIVGLAQAIKVVSERRVRDAEAIGEFRNLLQKNIESSNTMVANVGNSPRLPNHLSVCVKNAKSTNLVEAMDQQGIAVSAGSACSAKSLVESHVLTSIGLTPEEINKTLRISLGRGTTKADIETIASAISKI